VSISPESRNNPIPLTSEDVTSYLDRAARHLEELMGNLELQEDQQKVPTVTVAPVPGHKGRRYPLGKHIRHHESMYQKRDMSKNVGLEIH
jgi:hypothetical protein